MMKAYIIYKKYIYEDRNVPVIGGIQTYIENLTELLIEMGTEVAVIQESSFDFIKQLNNGLFVHGVRAENSTISLVNYAKKIGDKNNDLLIFATSTNTMKTDFKKTITIQHGIYWDYNTIHNVKPKFPFDLGFKLIQSFIELKKQKNVGTLVSVDYNYINWYRSITIHQTLNYCVIPNFTKIISRDVNKKINNDICIIYARRLEKIRGTELLIKVMPLILDKYKNVKLVIAGDGSQMESVKKAFEKYDSVNFIRYKPSDSLNIHSQCDIAIVPTIASEGTSLSLLEAMGSGCAVVCTDVGGMTNIVLNEFNGLIIKGNESMLYSAICDLIEDEEYRMQIASNAQLTIQKAFNLDKWKESWRNLLSSYDIQ